MNAPTLFDVVGPGARPSDPVTSQEAARLPDRNKWLRLVLGLFDVVGPLNTHEVWSRLPRTGYDASTCQQYWRPGENSIAKRISELHDLGFVERTGTVRPGGAGRNQCEWRATPAGRAALRS